MAIRIELHVIDHNGDYIKSGMFKELGGAKITYESHDYGFARDYRVRTVAPKGFTLRDVNLALREHYQRRCYHEHDCCGCVSTHIYDVQPAGKRNEYTFTIAQRQNV